MATYTYSFELKDKELCFHDIIIFKTYNEEIRYKVLPSFLSCISNKPNDYIFKVLDIKDKAEFCKECYGYKPKYPYELDFFPQCNTSDYKALTRATFVLLNLCEEKFGKKSTNKPIIKSLYQIGDKIIIKKEYDSGCNCKNYPYGFSLCMLKKYGGKIGVIKNIRNSHPDVELCKMFIEPFYYEIEIDGMICPEVFSASMFEGKKEDKEIFTFTDSDIPNNYPYNYAILDLSIQEDKNQHPNLTLLECFNRCISTSLCGLFSFQSSIMGNDFWVKVVQNIDKSYIPEMYEPKYYSPTSLLKEDSNFNKASASNPDYDNILDKSSFKKEFDRKELNISIPCSYEEVKFSIEKPKIKF